VKQVDLLYKLAARVAQLAGEFAVIPAGKPEFSRQGQQGPNTSMCLDSGQSMPGMTEYAFDRRATARLVKQLDEERKAAVEQLKHAVYLHRQMVWLQDRFPKAELQAVPGLVKLVDRKEIEAADWSLTPGRYVGVAPPEEDEDFDFEQSLGDIHVELVDLNKEAAELAAKIQENFEELGV
ncbi:MAG: SAM-dependent DNA methyltransferase, partial [bacterium]